MKKITVIIALLSIVTMAMLGCGSMVFSVVVTENNTVEVVAENADADSFGGAGTLEVGDNQRLSIEQNFEGDSKVVLKLIAVEADDMDEDAEELMEDIDVENAGYELELSGTEPMKYEIPEGDYFVNVTATSNKCTGTATIRVESNQQK